MPTKRRRMTRNLNVPISEEIFAVLLDEEPPVEMNRFERFELQFPTVCKEASRKMWLANREVVMPEFIRRHPGRRPSRWYLFDPQCPRVSPADIERYGWKGCFWLEHTPDLRRRLGGTGDPKFEHLNYVPSFCCGVPVEWMTQEEVDDCGHGSAIDPLSPPRYESQPSYLARHGLLTPAENRRLTPADFEPEVVGPDDEEGD